MKELEMESYAGNHISATIDEAIKLAAKNNCIVWFDFNQCKVKVSATTNKEHLMRDFDTHYIMGWKEIGHECVVEYSQDLKDEISEKESIQSAKSALSSAEYAHKEGKKKREIISKTNGAEMIFKDKGLWDVGLSKNTDGYGGAVYEFAKNWALLMQLEISKGKSIKDIAGETSHQADTVGLTGFMYGAAVSVLSACWMHGEDLRKWHNKEYGVSEDKEGVVNPAILTITPKG